MAVLLTSGQWRSFVRGCGVAAAVTLLAFTTGCAAKTGPAQPAAAAPAPAPPAAAPAPAAPPAPASPTASAPAAVDPLLGHVTLAQLKAYAPWAPFWEVQYAPDPAAVAAIKACPKDFTVLLVMGTWCPDSKRELPRYFATMAAAGVSDSLLTMVGVDRTKKDTEGLTDKWNITRVPTFVFLRAGQEFGRFVERTPAGSSFEAEIAKILGGGHDGPARR